MKKKLINSLYPTDYCTVQFILQKLIGPDLKGYRRYRRFLLIRHAQKVLDPTYPVLVINLFYNKRFWYQSLLIKRSRIRCIWILYPSSGIHNAAIGLKQFALVHIMLLVLRDEDEEDEGWFNGCLWCEVVSCGAPSSWPLTWTPPPVVRPRPPPPATGPPAYRSKLHITNDGTCLSDFFHSGSQIQGQKDPESVFASKNQK